MFDVDLVVYFRAAGLLRQHDGVVWIRRLNGSEFSVTLFHQALFPPLITFFSKHYASNDEYQCGIGNLEANQVYDDNDNRGQPQALCKRPYPSETKTWPRPTLFDGD